MLMLDDDFGLDPPTISIWSSSHPSEDSINRDVFEGLLSRIWLFSSSTWLTSTECLNELAVDGPDAVVIEA
jgi:hypothetical protein